ncbi:MAG: adenylate/guanylate cyclase domain-containing protein [Acidimicrobiia bacterium]
MTNADTDHRPGDCPACGASVLDHWRHCGSCGVRLGRDDVPEREHHVTMVVSDLQGSTALAERLDPESLRSVLDRYFDELGAVLESHGGRIEKRIGDMMVTVFGLPEPRPDDAIRAIRAAAETQQTLANLNDRLEATWGVRLTNRTGVATGPVVYATASGAHRLLVGEALEVASALEPLAPPLEVLASVATVHAVGALATFDPPQVLTAKSGLVVEAQRLDNVAAGESETITIASDGTCASCGAVAESGQHWCVECGLPVSRRQRREDRRRTVTIVFTDLRIVHLRPGIDATSERAAIIRAFEVARNALERHGGIVENFIGDAVMAIYGLDQRHEDDARRAAQAALDVQSDLYAIAGGLEHDFGIRLDVRIGVNTGPVVAGDPTAGERLVTGDAVNVAARLEQTAWSGAVVIGELTRQLIGPSAAVVGLEPLTLKGKAEPVPAYRLWDITSERVDSNSFELPLIGRDDEVSALHRNWGLAVANRRWHRLAVHGEAGIGKSRLVYELLDRVRGTARVLRGACLPYGEGITFWPIAEVVRQAAGITGGADIAEARVALARISPDSEVADRLSSLIGLDDRIVPVAELFWATRRVLDHLAAQQPLVVIIDGLHWAEPTLLELLDELIVHARRVPALLITMSRAAPGDGPAPFASDGFPDGGGIEDDRLDVIEVRHLSESETELLLSHALGSDPRQSGLRTAIARASAGVPLFVEQLLTMLIDDGRLVRANEGWEVTVPIEELSVPPTIEAVLAARIDALPADERSTLEPASVIGREFGRRAVEHLRGNVDAGPSLESLSKRQLVAPSPAPDLLADHRFRNLLIRDVAYDGLLKRTRSDLHLRFGDWLDRGPAAGHVSEFEEILGYHLERAYLLGTEVAAIDASLIDVGRRAALHLGAAGERAFARGDMPAAANLLYRAAHTLPQDPPRSARLRVLAGDASFEMGSFEEALRRYDEAEHVATGGDDLVNAAHARLARATQRYLTGDGIDEATVRSTTDDCQRHFESAGDEAGVARCWRLRAYVDLTHCQWGAAEQAASATIAHARRAGDHVLERRVLPALAAFSLYGPTPVSYALRRCDELLDAVDGDRRARALIQRSQAHLMALLGDVDAARALCASTRSSLLELGWNFDSALVSIDLGPIELMAGRAEAAERELRGDYETLRAMGEQNYLSTTTYLLAEAVRRQGRHDEALALSMEAAAIAAEDDVFSQAGWRSVQVRIFTDTGRIDEAVSLASEAVALVSTTDGSSAIGDAHLDFAGVLSSSGDLAAARDAATTALGCYRAKEHRVGEASAEQFLRNLS